MLCMMHLCIKSICWLTNFTHNAFIIAVYYTAESNISNMKILTKFITVFFNCINISVVLIREYFVLILDNPETLMYALYNVELNQFCTSKSSNFM